MNIRNLNDAKTLSKCADFTLASFPALKLLLDSNDQVVGQTTWAAKKGGLILTLSAANTVKDADGLGASSNLTITNNGVMPTVGKYVCMFVVGKSRTNSPVAGTGAGFGDTAVGPAINAFGTAVDAGAANTCATSAPVSQLTTNNRRTCFVGYVDCVTTPTPPIYRVQGNDIDNLLPNNTGAMSLGTNMNTMGNAPLDSSVINVDAMSGTTHAGARVRLVALFDFTNPVTLNELKLAATWMARNYGYIWPGFLYRS